MSKQTVTLSNGTMEVAQMGDGPVPLLLLYGFSILFPDLEYGALGEQLAEEYRVLIPSKFGYGFSDVTDAPRDVDTLVEEYRGMLSALHVSPPVVLAAHSMGFLEALRWAQKYPEEVLALVGLDPATPEVYHTFDLKRSLQQIESIHSPEWKRQLLFLWTVRSMLSRYPARLRKQLRPAARRNFAGLVWVNESRALPGNVEKILQDGPPASTPTLFLLSNGKGTPLPGEEWRRHALDYLDHFTDTQYELFDLPHDLYFHRPKDLAEVVLEFLSQVRDGSLMEDAAEDEKE